MPPVAAAPIRSIPIVERLQTLLPVSYCAGLLLAYAAIILLAPHPPFLQDYPTWVYEGVAVTHVLQGHSDLPFRLKHFAVPNALSDIGLGLLGMVAPWAMAAKLWLCVYLAVAFLACRQLVRALPLRATAAYWLAPSIVVVNLCFWWGFINFQFSVVLVLFFCAALLRHEGRNEWRHTGLLAALLVLIFLCHAISFAVCACALVISSFVRGRYRPLLALLPGFALTLWYVFGRFFVIGNPERAVLHDVPVPYMTRAFMVYKVNTFFKSLGYVNPILHTHPVGVSVFGRLGVYGLIIVTVVLACALLLSLVSSAWLSFRERAPERLLWFAFLISAGAALVSPSEGLGISDPGFRFMSLAFAIGIFLLKPGGRGVRVAAGCSVLLGIAGVVLFWRVAMAPEPSGSSDLGRVAAGFAHVQPEVRGYYYEELRRGGIAQPVFGTSILYNRVGGR